MEKDRPVTVQVNVPEKRRGKFTASKARFKASLQQKIKADREAGEVLARGDTRPPTDRQMTILDKYGIAGSINRTEATRIIGMIFDRNSDVWGQVELRDGFYREFTDVYQ